MYKKCLRKSIKYYLNAENTITMKKYITFFFIALTVSGLVNPGSFAQTVNIKQVKLTDFELQSSALIEADGAVISTSTYRSPVYWFPVKVPSTVLTGLVANGIYSDPYNGLNNMLIPDASEAINEKYNLGQYSHLPGESNPWKEPYWYRTTFTVPEADHGRHFQIIFKGINYRAAVWINGNQVADSLQMAGMFAEYSLNVSKYIKAGGENVLAVKIYPLDYPGLPSAEQLGALGDFYPNGGPTGDIGKNVTMLCSVGWDWMPPVRDRNMGIWLPVYLRTTGAVTIGNTRIVTELPQLPDTSIARISLSLTLFNHTGKKETGKLTVNISPENFPGRQVEFTKNVVSTILRTRNHPSLLVWTGGNEGHARKELYDFMRNSIISLDGTSPSYQAHQASPDYPMDGM